MPAIRHLVIPLAAMLLTACEPQSQTSSEDLAGNQVSGRWYSESDVALGESVFANNCAECHGINAEGLADDWRERLPDGSFPPPPLNGSAHAWHHPQSVLLQVISEGGIALGGKMPGFESVLDQQEKLAAIAYFQNFWSDEIYANWIQMGGTN